MEVIKRGDWQPPTFTAEIECYHCHSILKINADDVHWHEYMYGDAYGVQCPVCGHYPTLDWKTEKAYCKYLNTK